MSRRAFGGALIGAGLLAAGLVPLLGSASAAACPAWSDAPADATFLQMGFAQTTDPNLEILSAGVSTVGGDVVAKITVKKLTALPSAAGDEFSMQMTVGGQIVLIYADRLPGVGGSAGILNNTSDTDGGDATAVWDTATNTVTITAPVAEIDKAAGLATSGQPATQFAAGTSALVGFVPAVPYDQALPETEQPYNVGKACGGGTTPPPTPTPTPTGPTPTPTTPPGTLPAGYPKAGCNTIGDDPGDAKPALAGQRVMPQEDELDITGVAVHTTPTLIRAFVRIAALGDKPANGNGDRFEFEFNVGDKKYTFAGGRRDTVATQAAIDQTRGQLNGQTNAALKVTPTFDKDHDVVILDIERAGLDQVNGAPVAPGTVVTGTIARTFALVAGGATAPADTAQAAAAADQVYTIGVSPCFEPPAAKLANAGRTSVQYTDAAAVAAKITSATGQALAGKPVKFTIGSKSVTATSGADGVARASLNPALAAGTYSLVTSFAGDDVAGKVTTTTPFSIVAEKTRIAFTVAKSGARRTVTAKLLDDDNHAVAGQVITWYINGKKVSTAKTNSTGAVTLTTAKPTQTVMAVFGGVSGRYVASKTSTRV